MQNSQMLSWLKAVYVKAKSGDFEWKNIYPNNMPCNGVDGIYTDMFFERDGKYMYLKYSIEYQARCDKDGWSHPEEGVKYYVLHELIKYDLNETFEIPEPSDTHEFYLEDMENNLSLLVNDYGRYKCVFDDVETAKNVVSAELMAMIYPYTYLFSEDEIKEWNRFVEEQKLLPL